MFKQKLFFFFFKWPKFISSPFREDYLKSKAEEKRKLKEEQMKEKQE